MGYRTYHVDESEAMVLRSTTDGYQFSRLSGIRTSGR